MANQNPEWYKRLPAQILGGAIEGLGVPGDLLNAGIGAANTGLDYLFPQQQKPIPHAPNQPRIPYIEPEFTSQGIRENITQPLFGNALNPQNAAEEVISGSARNIPQIAATGGGSLAKNALALGSDLISGAAGKAVEKSGFGPLWQAAAGFLAGKGVDKFNNALTKTPNAVNKLSDLSDASEKISYGNVNKIGESLNFKADGLINKTSDIISEVYKNKSLEPAEKERVINKISEFFKEFADGSINGKQLFDARGQLNNIIGKETDKDIRRYFTNFKSSVVDAIENKGPKGNPLYKSYLKNLNSGDDVHKAKNFLPNLVEAIDYFPKISKALKNPLAQGAAAAGTTLWYTKDPFAALTAGAAVGFGGKTAKDITNTLAYLAHGPEPRRLVLEASKHVFDRNYEAAARTYNRLNNDADKFDKKRQEIESRKKSKRKKEHSHLVRIKK